MADKIWLKRALIPLWVVQILVCLVFIAGAALGLWVTNNEDLENTVEAAVNTGAAVILAFGIFTILLDVIEMIMVCAHKLGPIVNIVFQCVKSAVWTFYLIVTIRAAALGVTAGLIIFLVLAIFSTCMGQLAYGATIVHRYRKGTLYRGNYALAGYNTGYAGNYAQPPVAGGYVGQHPDPFRDPSQASLGYAAAPAAPPYPTTGVVGEYYSPHAVQQSYEMHGTGQR